MPAVSIIIPAFNAGRTIDEALQSVFAQTYRDFEVIVVDDGSADDTSQRVERWGAQVSCIRVPNGGPARARNIAIAHARGDLVALLDADDIWLPRKLQRQVQYFERFPETGLLHTRNVVTPAPVVVAHNTPDCEPLDAVDTPPAHCFADVFHCTYDVNTLTVMMPRSIVLEVGGFDERRDVHVEDWDLYLRIAARYPFGYLPLVLAVHRPGGTMSRAVERTFAGQRLVIDKIAPLCASACARHHGDGDACVRERKRQLFAEVGYRRFWNGRMTESAAAYRQARVLGLTGARAAAYHAAAAVFGACLRAVPPARRVVEHLATPSEPAPPRTNLLNDTMYGRARTAAVRALHAADETLSAARRTDVRILFEAASPMSVAVFRPVLDRLQADPRIAVWFTTSDGSWDANQIFRAAGLTDRIVTSRTARRMKFDAYVNTDFWNMTWLPRRTRRIHLFHGVAGKYGLDSPTSIAPVVHSFDRLMFPNRDRLQKYVDAGLVDADDGRAALIGYPKVDCLVDGSLDRAATERSFDLESGRPTVLYAPTWSPYSSLHRHGLAIVEQLCRRDWNVVVKLHDRSFEQSTRGSDGIDWRRELDRLGRCCRLHVARGADASPYLFIADALVTDHSSVGFEYLLLDRPLVIVDCPELLDKANVNREKVRLLRSAAQVVGDGAGAADAVARGLDHTERLSVRRREIADELFYCAGGATDRAAACIYNLLSLPAPQSSALARNRPRATTDSFDPTHPLPAYDARTTSHA
jgi:glycosyltransferase involved in cell wall biosynthesis